MSPVDAYRKHAEAVVELQRYLGEDLWALFKRVGLSFGCMG